jgi:microcystin degradation protein MlrC
VLIGRETYPEIDQAERGRECADVLNRILTEGLRPTMAISLIPMIWGLHQVTAHRPMSEAIEYLHEIESRPGVVCGSIAVSYFLADVPDMGSSVYVVTDNDPALAQKHADELADWCFKRRADWHYELPSTRDAIRQAEENGKFPVIFADSRDNTGGGSPGDSTGMLRAFIEADLQDACVLYMVDREAIAACTEAGVGVTLTLDIGGKSSPLQGEPVTMTVEVMAISNGRFMYDGPMYAGLEGKMGPSVYVRQGGVHVILVTIGEQPFCTAFSRSLGLDPKKMRTIGVKSTAHFRAGFEPWAAAIQLVSEPGLHNLGGLPFKRLGRKVYPLDDI